MITKTFTDTNLLKQLKESAQKDFISKIIELFIYYKNEKSLDLFLSYDYDLEDKFIEFISDEMYEIKNVLSAYYVPSYHNPDFLNIFIFDRTEIDDCARDYINDYCIGKVNVSMCVAFGIERAIYDFLNEHDDDIIDLIQYERTQFIYYVMENLHSKFDSLFETISDDFNDKYEFVKDYIINNNIEDINLLLK